MLAVIEQKEKSLGKNALFALPNAHPRIGARKRPALLPSVYICKYQLHLQLFTFVNWHRAQFTSVKCALQTLVGHFCDVSKMVSRGTILKMVAHATIS